MNDLKNSTLHQIHVKETIKIEQFSLSIKLTQMEEYIGGKEYEEFGDRTDLKLLVQSKKEKKEIVYSRFQRTPDEVRHFQFFGFEFLIIKTSFEPFCRKDNQGDWLKFIVYPIQNEEIQYEELHRHFLKLDAHTLS